ncbi:MAG: 16S rRNA (adenine(1518)-N(6)/adenine(1519)-N(6))-dimethyltransferase RsmA [Candidatus Nanohaloarchaea archaeon]|nr:16S rRNA (adenine(1518)-N(6)/adenine(1519)-N(6))-dimethyltransferase RsmA [Candidatus Nanohaloarchaea archaeon]
MIKETLQRHGLEPDPQQGQHFLADERILQQEVREAEVSADDTLLEIGAGIGNLTRKLTAAAGHVHAVERDKRMVAALREELDGIDNVDVIEGDILELDWPEFDKCVSNPPYEISSELIERLGKAGQLSVLTLQQAFAEKLVAEPGSSGYSRISVLANYHFIPVYIRDVSRESFYPPPEVDSALLKLFPREKQFGIEDEDAFFEVVRALFTHKRKKVRNAFVDSRHILDMDKDAAKAMRDDLPHSEERVINLDLQKLAEVTAFLEDKP